MNYLIQMAGFPGSGKSTLAKILSQKLPAIVIDRDIIKNAMMQVGITQDPLNQGSYQVVYDLADFYLKQELNVIIDTPCYYDEIVMKGIDISNRNNAQYKYIECVVESYDQLISRLKSREHLATQITHVSEELYYRDYKKSVKPKDDPYLSVDSSDLMRLDFDEILAYVQDDTNNVKED